MFKIIAGLWPFVRDLAFSKDLGATKGRWRRLTRVSLISQFVLLSMVIICIHQVFVQVELRSERDVEITRLKDELALTKLICTTGCNQHCSSTDDHYYEHFFGKE